MSKGHDIDRWQASAGNEAEDGDLGIVARLLRCCIDSLSQLSHCIDLFPIRKQLRRSLVLLKLWADGHGAWDGRLDNTLERSKNLRHVTLSILNPFLKSLSNGTYKYAPPNPDDLIAVNLRTTTARLYSQTRWLLMENEDGVSDSDSDSESNASSDEGEGNSLASLAADVKMHVQCLTDLSNTLEYPAIDPEPSDEPSVPMVRLRTAHDYHKDLIVAKFPNVQPQLAECLGKISWDRYQRMQHQREINATMGEKPLTEDEGHLISVQKSHAADSEFKDSGLGTSLPSMPATRYAETVISFMTSMTEGKRIHIPPLPSEGRTGVKFECTACGRHIRALNNRDWRKHLYLDLQPYTCLYDSCTFSLKPFADRQLWSKHLELDHELGPNWKSVTCPLCLDPTDEGKSKILIHFARHLEDIALAALPREVESEDDADAVSRRPSNISASLGKPVDQDDENEEENKVDMTLCTPTTTNTTQDLSGLDNVPGLKPELERKLPTALDDPRIYHDDPALPPGSPNQDLIEGIPVNTVLDEEPTMLKCICGFSEDDGNIVLCETCDTWQHIVCYYDSAQSVSDIHECVDCMPRPIDREESTRKQHLRREVRVQLDIERRCRQINPPIARDILHDLKSFKAAIKISQPWDEHAWSILYPRLLTEYAEQAEDESKTERKQGIRPKLKRKAKEQNATKDVVVDSAVTASTHNKADALLSHDSSDLQSTGVNYTRTGRISKARKSTKVHNCECGRSYTRVEHLRRHQKNHAYDDKLACSFCARTFFRQDLLERHIERHKNDDKLEPVATLLETSSSKEQPASVAARVVDCSAPDPPNTTSQMTDSHDRNTLLDLEMNVEEEDVRDPDPRDGHQDEFMDHSVSLKADPRRLASEDRQKNHSSPFHRKLLSIYGPKKETNDSRQQILPTEDEARQDTQQKPKMQAAIDSSVAVHDAAPGPIPATRPVVVRQDQNGVQWIAFEYYRDRVKMEYTIRCDVESINVDELSQDFKTENCVYPRACLPRDRYMEYPGNVVYYETECNTLGWTLAKLNPCLRGKRGLIQRAVDTWRNSNPDSRLRTQRERRTQKMTADKAQPTFQDTLTPMSTTSDLPEFGNPDKDIWTQYHHPRHWHVDHHDNADVLSQVTEDESLKPLQSPNRDFSGSGTTRDDTVPVQRALLAAETARLQSPSTTASREKSAFRFGSPYNHLDGSIKTDTSTHREVPESLTVAPVDVMLDYEDEDFGENDQGPATGQ